MDGGSLIHIGIQINVRIKKFTFFRRGFLKVLGLYIQEETNEVQEGEKKIRHISGWRAQREEETGDKGAPSPVHRMQKAGAATH